MSTDFDFTAFDADTIDTSDNYDPIPEGTYECVVEKTEMLPTKKGDGSYLKLTFSVIDGQYDGRKFFTNFNLVNPSAAAEEIGRKNLAKVQKAIGRPRIQSHEELCDIPLQVRISIRKEEGFKPQNEFVNCWPSEKYPPEKAAPAAAPAQQPAPAPAPAPQPAPAPAPAQQPAPAAAPAAATVQPRKVAPWKRQ